MSSSPIIPSHDQVIEASLEFYDAQRAGKLPDDFRIPWRGHSTLQDGSDYNIDLSGGFYDAGDHVKFMLPMANSMTLLAWYGDLLPEGANKRNLQDIVKWGNDWIQRCWRGDKFFVQVGDPKVEHGHLKNPEQIDHPRPSFFVTKENPGSEPSAEAVAALVSAALLLETSDPNASEQFMLTARELYEFTTSNTGQYHISVPIVEKYYKSFNGYYDELAWAALWLYKGTKEEKYLADHHKYYELVSKGGTPCWDNKWAYLVLLRLEVLNDDTSKQEAATLLTAWLEGKDFTETPAGLAWVRKWGSLRYAANMAFVAIHVGRIQGNPEATKFGKTQIDYILGKNPLKKCFVIGFPNSPKNPHHRGAANQKFWPWTTSVLNGALVGGPTKPDDSTYSDRFSDYVANEVALDYNAGFTGALIGLQYLAKP